MALRKKHKKQINNTKHTKKDGSFLLLGNKYLFEFFATATSKADGLSQRHNKKAYSILEIIVSLSIVGFAMVVMINFLILGLQISIFSLARSFIREEMSNISTLISRDLRGADIIVACGDVVPTNMCEFVINGERFRWELCDNNTRVCKNQIIGTQVTTVFTSSQAMKANSLEFIYGAIYDTSNQSAFNVIVTLSASHATENYNINNIVKQTSVSTRNFEYAGSVVAIVPPNPSPNQLNPEYIRSTRRSDGDLPIANGKIGLGSSTKGDDIHSLSGVVLLDGSTYKLWYTGHDGTSERIYLATSPDGLSWTKYDNTTPANSDTTSTNGRIPLGTAGKGDSLQVRPGSVIKDGSTYKMWYTGWNGSNWRIFYATSPDSLTWTKYDNTIPAVSDLSSTNGRIPVGNAGRIDGTYAYGGRVIIDGSTYKMWYSAYNGSNWRISYATSSDGLNWTKYDNSVPAASNTTGTNGRIPLGVTGGDTLYSLNPNVVKDAGTYKMWYGGYAAADSTARIYYATSPDGLTWTKLDNTIPAASNTTGTNGRVPKGTTGGDTGNVENPMVIKDVSTYKMWYIGFDAANWRIYHVTSPDGLTWTKFSNTVPGVMDSGYGQTTAQTNQYIVKGWNYVNGPSTGPTKAVNYGITFSDIPIVVAERAGGFSSATPPATLSACSSPLYWINSYLNIGAVSATSFTAQQYFNGTSIPATDYLCFGWIAVGTYSGADLAENYLTYDTTLKPGDLVAIDENNNISVRKTNSKYDKGVYGIVSTAPGKTLGGENGESADFATKASLEAIEENKKLITQDKAKVVAVALEGRVPLKVTLENGVIKKGDYLTASSKPGYAMKATEPGQIIGRALEGFDGTQSIIDSSDEEYQLIQEQLEQGKKLEEIDLSGINFSESETKGEGKIIATLERGMYLGEGAKSLDNKFSEFYSALNQGNILRFFILSLVGIIFSGLIVYRFKKRVRD